MLYLAGIAENSIVDGPGLRFTVFAQGCPHRCPGCQNPETWPAGGHAVMPEQLLEQIRQDPLVRGVTLSGGEPFGQAAEFARLARLLRAAGYEVACYTGYLFEEIFQNGKPDQWELLRNLDILVDGPFVEAEKSLELAFRGSRNQRILDVPASLAAGQAVWTQSPRWVLDESIPPAAETL